MAVRVLVHVEKQADFHKSTVDPRSRKKLWVTRLACLSPAQWSGPQVATIRSSARALGMAPRALSLLVNGRIHMPSQTIERGHPWGMDASLLNSTPYCTIHANPGGELAHELVPREDKRHRGAGMEGQHIYSVSREFDQHLLYISVLAAETCLPCDTSCSTREASSRVAYPGALALNPHIGHLLTSFPHMVGHPGAWLLPICGKSNS